ncbi:hypothetical protein, partial [Xenorhabdus bovienii]|uniref:hypothetical protein n=1 Tax=Xenorhabdus bovienii TaxID=40576 RepID=UPI0023B2E63A
ASQTIPCNCIKSTAFSGQAWRGHDCARRRLMAVPTSNFIIQLLPMKLYFIQAKKDRPQAALNPVCQLLFILQ